MVVYGTLSLSCLPFNQRERLWFTSCIEYLIPQAPKKRKWRIDASSHFYKSSILFILHCTFWRTTKFLQDVRISYLQMLPHWTRQDCLPQSVVSYIQHVPRRIPTPWSPTIASCTPASHRETLHRGSTVLGWSSSCQRFSYFAFSSSFCYSVQWCSLPSYHLWFHLAP